MAGAISAFRGFLAPSSKATADVGDQTQLEILEEPRGTCSTTKYNPYDKEKQAIFENLQTAYSIATYTQSFFGSFSEKLEKGEVRAFCERLFKAGPKASSKQTETGLAVECNEYGIPFRMHTSLGVWNYLGTTEGSCEKFKKIGQLIGQVLELEPLNTSEDAKGKLSGIFAVKSFKGTPLPPLVYKKNKTYISLTHAQELWKEFSASHSDLT